MAENISELVSQENSILAVPPDVFVSTNPRSWPWLPECEPALPFILRPENFNLRSLFRPTIVPKFILRRLTSSISSKYPFRSIWIAAWLPTVPLCTSYPAYPPSHERRLRLTVLQPYLLFRGGCTRHKIYAVHRFRKLR